jgi:hypothetical protein
MLVKMLRREAGVAGLVQHLHLGLPFRRNPLARNLAEPAVQQTGRAVVLVALQPAPERPLPNTQQFRSFQLPELRCFITAQNIQKLDHPHTLMGFRPAHPAPQKADKLPDRSCAT